MRIDIDDAVRISQNAPRATGVDQGHQGRSRVADRLRAKQTGPASKPGRLSKPNWRRRPKCRPVI